MFGQLVLGAFVLWMILGGAFQLVTGRDAGIASFRSHALSDPSPRVARISGVVALVVGLILVPVFVGWIAGAFPPK